MIYDGVITKPPLDELYHTKHPKKENKAHKYIERFKNAKGEWTYRYTERKKNKPMPRNTRIAVTIATESVKTLDKGYKKLKEGKKKMHYGKNDLRKTGKG